MVQRVESKDAAVALAEGILAPRARPLVVVSTLGYNGGDVSLDLARIESELAGLADVAILVTGDVSRVLEGLLPERLQVYGGAARSYPIDIGANPDQRRSPLRFPSPDATELVIGDALAHAYASGAITSSNSRGAAAAGTVIGLVAGRGLVALDGGGTAGIVRELVWPWMPFDWVVAPGQRVVGRHDPGSGHFTLDMPSVTTETIEAAFPHRSVTLALVRTIDADHATLALHPDYEVRIGARDVSPNERDRIELLLAEGDVVPARVLHLTTGVHLQLLDVDDDEQPLQSLPVLAGGAPWLVDGRHLRAQAVEVLEAPSDGLLMTPSREPADDDVDAVSENAEPPAPDAPSPAYPVPKPGITSAIASSPAEAPTSSGSGRALRDTQLSLARANARIHELEQRLADLGADDSAHRRLADTVRRGRDVVSTLRLDLSDADRRIADLETQLSEVKRTLRERTRKPSIVNEPSRSDRRARWASDEEWVRHELYLAWVERVPSTDRAALPILGYTVSERFALSLIELDDDQFEKALKAAVDVITGLVKKIPGRELHALRTGISGNAPPHRRASDGALCYRVYIEQNTASARRLHFWQPDNASLELERVVTHDTVDP